MCQLVAMNPKEREFTMKECDIMTSHNVWACAETSDCRHVAQMMAEHNIGAVPVLDSQGRLEGIITDRDICCRLVAEGKSFETPAREIMSTSVHTCGADTSLDEIESAMCRYKIRRLPVVDSDNRLQGFISLGDLAMHVHGLLKEHHLAEVLEAVSART
jgi:CBS domain-containing protein